MWNPSKRNIVVTTMRKMSIIAKLKEHLQLDMANDTRDCTDIVAIYE